MVSTSSVSPNKGQAVLLTDTVPQANILAAEINTTNNLLLLDDQLVQKTHQVLSRARLLAIQPRTTDLVSLIYDLTSGNTIHLLQKRAKEYIDGFQYRPINEINGSDVTYKTPVKYSLDDSTLPMITDLVIEACTDAKIAPQVLERILFKPAVIAKLALMYEHPGMMTGANTEAEKIQLVKKLIRQFANDDSVLRYIKEELPVIKTAAGETVDVYRIVTDNPELYARAAIAHRWTCKRHNVDPNDVDKQKTLKNGSNPISEEILRQVIGSEQKRSLKQMIANLRSEAPIPCDTNITIGETVFFRPLIDNKTLSLTQFVLDAFERGIRNVEVSTDFLPFDSSKRLPGEYTDEEISRVKELAKCLGMSFTVHSPIVGPLHPKTKFTALLEDAADNVQIMKDTIDFAGKLGARTVVVHISDRNSKEAISKYAEIASHAVGKYSTGGKPLRVSFENYMSKALPGGNKPFPTMEEHFVPFSKIIKKVVQDAIASGENSAEALKHIALLLDSAHFNLVPNMKDPLRAVQVLPTLIEDLALELLSNPETGPKLVEGGFNLTDFTKGIVAQLHLNQNIGPIGFTVPGQDYNADIHNPVESIGTIDTIGFVSLVHDLGFGDYDRDDKTEDLVILAEQKKILSPGGLQILYNAAKDCPGTIIPPGLERVNYFIQEGDRVISDYKQRQLEKYLQIKSLLEDRNGTPYSYYEYIAGRLGMNHLIEHLQRRALHLILSPQSVGLTKEFLETLPVHDVALHQYDKEELIIKKGTTYKQAQEEDNNRFYLVAQGQVEIQIPGGDNIKLNPGTPFGEAMFLSGTPRNANVIAGPNGATVIEISESDFWAAYKLLVPFQERLDTHFNKRVTK